jgi:glutathione synthase/RimK-type ligase-like ATP-grasp enzyme
MHYGSGESKGSSLCQNLEQKVLEAADIGAIWWHRPQPFQLDPGILRESHRTFAYNECWEAFTGFWQTLDSQWVNHPLRDQAAARKAYQLKVAERIGLDVPKTLISNNPDEARRFIQTLGYEHTVYKAFSATEANWRETRILRQEELDLLRNVRHAPVIFQEYIAGGPDLRITIVNRAIFAAAIYAQDTEYPIDFRVTMHSARIEPFDIPGPLKDKLRLFMARLGLIYGAIDMRRAEDGRYVFFEVNPAGQWLFIEQRTHQPITSMVAETLAEYDGARQRPSGRRNHIRTK